MNKLSLLLLSVLLLPFAVTAQNTPQPGKIINPDDYKKRFLDSSRCALENIVVNIWVSERDDDSELSFMEVKHDDRALLYFLATIRFDDNPVSGQRHYILRNDIWQRATFVTAGDETVALVGHVAGAEVAAKFKKCLSNIVMVKQ